MMMMVADVGCWVLLVIVKWVVSMVLIVCGGSLGFAIMRRFLLVMIMALNCVLLEMVVVGLNWCCVFESVVVG